METDRKPLACELATHEESKKTRGDKWTIRSSVVLAGCTDPTRQGDFRTGTLWGRDNGYRC